MGSYAQLRDPQCEYALMCLYGVVKTFFSPHLSTELFKDAHRLFDINLRNTLQNIVVSDGDGFGDLLKHFYTHIFRLEDLGISCVADFIKFTILAS